MKILFPFVGDNIGGSHISSLYLINNLNKKKYRPLIVLHEKGNLFKYLKKNKIKFYFLDLPLNKNLKKLYLNPMLLFKNIFKIRNFIIKKNIKIIHGNDLRINFIWSIASLKISKYIWHQRTLIKENSKINLFSLIFSKYIICISNSVRNSFGFKNFSKIKKIYNSFDKESKIIVNNTKKKRIIILLCSKLIKEKNVDLFFQIVDKFYLSKKKFLFWVLGDGDLKKKYQKKFNKNKNIKFFGFKENTRNYFRKADILIAPSVIEAFGRTLVESLNNGTYVIASKNKSFKEISKNKELIDFSDNNPNSFISKINLTIKKGTYLRKKDIQKIFQKSLDQNFSSKNIKKIEKVYEQTQRH